MNNKNIKYNAIKFGITIGATITIIALAVGEKPFNDCCSWFLKREKEKVLKESFTNFEKDLNRLWIPDLHRHITKDSILSAINVFFKQRGLVYMNDMGGGLAGFQHINDVRHSKKLPKQRPLEVYIDVSDWPHKLHYHFNTGIVNEYRSGFLSIDLSKLPEELERISNEFFVKKENFK